MGSTPTTNLSGLKETGQGFMVISASFRQEIMFLNLGCPCFLVRLKVSAGVTSSKVLLGQAPLLFTSGVRHPCFTGSADLALNHKPCTWRSEWVTQSQNCSMSELPLSNGMFMAWHSTSEHPASGNRNTNTQDTCAVMSRRQL